MVANFDESGIIGIHPCTITSHSLRKRFMAKMTTAITKWGWGQEKHLGSGTRGGGVEAFLDDGCCHFCHETLPK